MIESTAIALRCSFPKLPVPEIPKPTPHRRFMATPRSILMFTLYDTVGGAPPGVGARYLARRDSSVFGLLGVGVMARTTLAAFMVACPGLYALKINDLTPVSGQDIGYAVALSGLTIATGFGTGPAAGHAAADPATSEPPIVDAARYRFETLSR